MRTLKDFLLAEANIVEGDEKDKKEKPKEEPKPQKSLSTFDYDNWKALAGIPPGVLSNELKKLLAIKSAKDAKLFKGGEEIKAVQKPSAFRKDIKIAEFNNFEQMITTAVKNSQKEFREFFSGSVDFYKHHRRGKIAKIRLSDNGKSLLKKDKQLIRFYKFWFDCIFWACMKDRINPQTRDKKELVKYKIDANCVYVHYREA